MQPNPVAQFDSMQQRRTLLEALTQLTCNLNSTDAGLSAVQNIILPSQQFSEQLRQSLNVEISVYQPQETPALQLKLAQLNEVVEKNYTLLLRVVEIDDAAFLKHFKASDDDREGYKKLQAKLIQFKKQAHHSLAIRSILKDRGVQVERSKLALNQEFLAEKLIELRSREKATRKRMHKTILEMVSDNDQLLQVVGRNHDTRAMLMQNSENLRNTLALLKSGNNIETLPMLIEEIHYGTLSEQLTVASSTAPETTPASKTHAADSQKSANTPNSLSAIETNTIITNNLLARIIIWFTTGGDVNWADTKHHQDK